MKQIDFFDKDGKRIYIYSLYDYECSSIFCSYTQYTEEDIQNEIAKANRTYKEYLKEYNEIVDVVYNSKEKYDDLLKEVEEKKGEELKALDIKYPISEWSVTDRLINNLHMWILEPSLSVDRFFEY